MSKKPFIVGERVSVSGWVKDLNHVYYYWDKMPATVYSMPRERDGLLSVILNTLRVDVHQNQIRRLKPKAKPREFWISLGSLYISGDSMPVFFEETGGCIHVREVREKK